MASFSCRHSKKWKSHYHWLDIYLPKFFKDLGISWENNCGIISAHGDKFYTYEDDFKNAGLHFFHGVAIGLLTYVHPYSEECRETSKGWVPVHKWIVENKDRFIHLLPPVEE